MNTKIPTSIPRVLIYDSPTIPLSPASRPGGSPAPTQQVPSEPPPFPQPQLPDDAIAMFRLPRGIQG